MMIYSQGNLEPIQPEPPSRSPSPDLPSNFVPKPPVESTTFPAASNITTLLSRVSGGVSLRDLIIVPAATWDRNNTMWEHKTAQLRKKHRKALAEKEVELRRKYDEQYSDARYREMVLAKEMKEMDFTQNVANGEILGKTWKEHKAAKKNMENTYTEKLKEAEKKLGESKETAEELRKKLAEKETAIEALQDAISRRSSAEEVQQPQQPQQPQQSQKIQRFQQPHSPQYQIPILDSNVVTHSQNHTLAPPIFHQHLPQHIYYTHQQQYQPKSPQVEDQTMAVIRANANASRLRHQGGPHSQFVENHQQNQDENRGKDIRNSQGNDSHHEHGSRNNPFTTSSTVVVGNGSGQYSYPIPEPPTVAQWNNSFPTPQHQSIATKEHPLPPVVHLYPSSPFRPNNESTPSPSPFISMKSAPTFGLSGPFGSHKQSMPSAPFRSVSDIPSAFKPIHDPKECLGGSNGATTEAAPFRTTMKEASPEVPEAIGANPGTGEVYGGHRSLLRRTGESKNQKRRHSDYAIGHRVPSKAKKPRGDGGYQPDLPQDSSSLNKSHSGDVAMGQEEIDKAIEEVAAEYIEQKTAVVGEKPISEIDLSNEEDKIAADLIREAENKERIVCVKLKEGVRWSGPEYIMKKIRGGVLESVHVYDKDHEVFVSFISPTAAKKFYDFFNQNPDGKEAFIRFKLFVRWVPDAISPISHEIADVVANGARRCLKIFQIPTDKLVEDIKAEFSRDKGPFSVLSVHLSTEKSRRKDNGGMGKVARVEFSTIMLAMETKGKIQAGEMGGYQNCDVEFSDDPCERKDGKLCTMDSMRTWPI